MMYNFQLTSLTLQLCVWDDGGLDPDLFCGEVLIDCNECDLTGQMLLTFPLQEHDLSVGQMPAPAPKFLLVKNKKNSTGSSNFGQYTSKNTSSEIKKPSSIDSLEKSGIFNHLFCFHYDFCCCL